MGDSVRAEQVPRSLTRGPSSRVGIHQIVPDPVINALSRMAKSLAAPPALAASRVSSPGVRESGNRHDPLHGALSDAGRRLAASRIALAPSVRQACLGCRAGTGHVQGPIPACRRPDRDRGKLAKIPLETLAALIDKQDLEIPLVEAFEIIAAPDGSATDAFAIPAWLHERRRNQQR